MKKQYEATVRESLKVDAGKDVRIYAESAFEAYKKLVQQTPPRWGVSWPRELPKEEWSDES